MSLYFGSYGSAAALATKAIGRLFADETDKAKLQIGSEGNPIALAKRRGETFWDFKVVELCTATTPEGYINRSYSRSNMQKVYVPCPNCGEYQLRKFGRLKVDPPGLRDPDIIREKECVYYECEHCNGKMFAHQNEWIVNNGVWCPKGCTVNKDGQLVGTPKRGRRHSGFWITEMLSPWQNWAKMLADWFTLNKDPVANATELREFKNQVLAQTWEERGRKVDENKLKKNKNDLLRRAVPTNCKLLTAAVDYHENTLGDIRLDYQVRAFAPGNKRYVIDAGSVETWEEFEDLVLMMPFPWADDEFDDEELAVIRVFADSGFEADKVYEWCRKFPGIAFPVKGTPGMTTPLKVSRLDEVVERAEKKSRRKRASLYKGMLLYTVDTDFFKDRVTTSAEKEKGLPGSTEFFVDCPDHFFTEFSNEHKVARKKAGRTVFIWDTLRKGLPTHSLDHSVYADAAGYKEKAHLLKDDSEAERIPAALKNKKKKRPRRRFSEAKRQRR
jgi:phage terminase large subunit GpA-like protein